MRCVLLLAGVFLLAACPAQNVGRLPPQGQFYFPTGIVHTDSPFRLADGGPGEGLLYVASSNFDKRYDVGSVTAVELNRVGLPAFGAPVNGGVAHAISNLRLEPGSSVQIASFAGEMAALPLPGGLRLYVPTRSEQHRLYAIDAPSPASAGDAPKLNCFQPSQASGVAVEQDCTATGLSLVEAERSPTGVPRAPAPIGVAISPPPGREVWVTSMQQADSPVRSALELRAYVVHVNGDDPVLTLDGGQSSFVNVGAGGSSSVAVGARHAYLTGRQFSTGTPANLLRTIDTRDFTAAPMSLENTFSAFEGRGVALASDQSRIYVVGQTPGTLLVASVTGQENPVPQVRVVRSIPLPEGPGLVTAIPRPGKSDLVVISCTTAGVLAFYDDDVGNLVAQISGVGLQPYALAVDTRPSPVGDPAGGARVYVTNFTDGRVAVIDVPELTRPASARIVAYLGASQLCITRGANERGTCDGGGP